VSPVMRHFDRFVLGEEALSRTGQIEGKTEKQRASSMGRAKANEGLNERDCCSWSNIDVSRGRGRNSFGICSPTRMEARQPLCGAKDDEALSRGQKDVSSTRCLVGKDKAGRRIKLPQRGTLSLGM
jgi:hypothetical protein